MLLEQVSFSVDTIKQLYLKFVNVINDARHHPFVKYADLKDATPLEEKVRVTMEVFNSRDDIEIG